MLDEIFIISICSLPASVALFAVARLARHADAIRQLANAEAPSLYQSEKLTAFQQQIEKEQKGIELCSFFSFAWVMLSMLVLFFCVNTLSNWGVLIAFAYALGVGIAQSKIKKREKATVKKLLKSSATLQRFLLLEQFQALQRPADSAATGQQSTLSIDLLKQGSSSENDSTALLSQAQADMLKRAHHAALGETVSVGEKMLVILKGKEQKLSVFLAPAELVWEPTLENGLETGRIYCAELNFTGGRVAHYDRSRWPIASTETAKEITHAWIATPDRAYILLSVLRWLNDDQRRLINELVNPGTSFPVDWLPIATSRGSWQL